jgi:hypothetical protein
MQNSVLEYRSKAPFHASIVPKKSPAEQRQDVSTCSSARREDLTLRAGFPQLAELCWPFHQSVIEQFRIRVVLCLGNDAGDWVRRQLGASSLVGQFVEKNGRRWKSSAYANSNGVGVVVATHPSIADWTKAAIDPTPLLRQLLADA